MGQPFEQSDAWQSARVVTNTAYALCRSEPLARDFGLRDQLQRAAVSVMNNVAEGWESVHAGEKRQACNTARRSCDEVRSMTYVLLDNRYIGEVQHSELLNRCIQTGQIISGLLRSLR